MASEREKQSARWSLDEVRKLLTEVMKVPVAWVVPVVAFAVLSCLKITHPAHGGTELEFAVTTTTVGAVALVWLPPLLRVLTLTGGRLKAAGMEASSDGLLGSDADLLNSLTSIKTATEEAGRKAPEARGPRNR